MKILLAGAFGNLGIEILRVLSEGGHEIIAADLNSAPLTRPKRKH